MAAMSTVDRELFREKYEDLKYMDSKCNNNETFGQNVTEITAQTKSDLDELIRKTVREKLNFSRKKRPISVINGIFTFSKIES